MGKKDMRIKFTGLVFTLFLSFCNMRDTSHYLKIFSNDGKGKYWDLIYQSDVGGKSQEVLAGPRRLPTESIYFFDRKMIQYYIYDSVKVIDINKVSGDIIFSNYYRINNDTMNLNGHIYLIQKLTDDSLKLKDPKSKSRRIYIASKFQNREVLDSLPY